VPPPSEAVVFFIDRSLGKRDVPDALRKAGAAVEVHDDHFPQDADDVTWLRAVGARGWAVLTKDERIRRRETERRALTGACVAAFLLTAGDVKGASAGRAFVAALQRMRRILAKYDRPLIATVTAMGAVKVLLGERRGGKRK
jgi:hypothetical protein